MTLGGEERRVAVLFVDLVGFTSRAERLDDLDEILRAVPTTWPRKKTADGEMPLILPTLRTAAVDGDGNLSIALLVPYTYVYDAVGDKMEIMVELHGLWTYPAALTIAEALKLAVKCDPVEQRMRKAQKDGKLTVWTGTQRPFGVRTELAEAFRLPLERVRVIVPDTSSAYGGKHTGETAVEAARLAKTA